MKTEISDKLSMSVWRVFVPALFLAGAAAVSCNKGVEEDESPGLRTTNQSLEFQYSATQYPVTVMTLLPWTAEVEQQGSDGDVWLSTDVTEGSGNAVIKVIATENNSDEQRTGTVRISCQTNTVSISVVQKPDTRNFTDIWFDGTLFSYMKSKGCRLVIPYRNGGGQTIEHLSVNIAGTTRGSLRVEPLDGVTLAEGEGVIELDVSGRPGDTGNIIFTVMGLPSGVYGEAAQCKVEVAQGDPVENTSIAAIRKMYSESGGAQVQITGQLRINATAISDSRYGATPDDRVVVADGVLADCGIVIVCPDAHEVEAGDQCEIFLKNASVKKSGGVLVAEIEDFEDLNVVAKYVPVKPVALPGTDLSGYESMLCGIELSQIDDSDAGKPTYSGNNAFKRFGVKDGFNLYVPESSAMAATGMQSGSGTATGIVGVNDASQPALLPRSPEELAVFGGPRYDLSAVFYPDNPDFDIIPVGGGNFSFDLYSSIAWEIECGDDWITLATTSGAGHPSDPHRIGFAVEANSYGRRTATLILKGEDVPDLPMYIVQEEAMAVLSTDMSPILELYEGPDIFPLAGGVNFNLRMDEIGMEGWTVSDSYLSRTSLGDDAEPLLRVGKSSSRGYIETPYLTNLTSASNIELQMNAATYSTTLETWIGVELTGPGTIQTGGGVLYLTANTAEYPVEKVTVPCYLITGLTNLRLTPVSVKIAGATSETKIKLRITYKSPGSLSAVYSFFINNVGIYYY